MKVILHIGVHKTGTTLIQRTLHRNAALLMQDGFFYKPHDPRNHNHHAIAIGLMGNTEIRDWATTALREQTERTAAAKCHTCIISSEAFLDNPDLALIRQLLADHTVRVIAYLRSPDQIVASAHNEVVRDSLKRWQRALGEHPYPYDPSYWTILFSWLDAFSPGELTLAPFDPKQWASDDLVTDFLQMIGLRENLKLERSLDDAEMNISLPASMIEIVRLANAIVPMTAAVQTAFVHGLYELRKQYPQLYPSDVTLMDRNQRRDCYRLLAPALPKYRPYFRPGFKDDFLRWPSIGTRIANWCARR